MQVEDPKYMCLYVPAYDIGVGAIFIASASSCAEQARANAVSSFVLWFE